MDPPNMTFNLQRIMKAGVAALLAACLIATSVAVAWNLSASRRHEEALAQFDRFTLAIRMMAAVSMERGPAHLSMRGSDEDAAAARGKLAAARGAVDHHIDALAQRFSAELGRIGTLREDVELLRLALAEGRKAVDGQLALPLSDRNPVSTVTAIRDMFVAADRARVLRDVIGQVMIDLSPDLATLLMVAAAVSDLRENAGRLGSVVVMRTTMGPAADALFASEFASMLALTDTLHGQIENYAAPFIANEEVARAMKAVTFGYVTGARAYAETIFAAVRAGNEVSMQTFNDRYAPGLRTTETLREKILDVARAKLTAQRDRSLELAGMSVVVAVVGMAIVLAALAMFERGVFKPLLTARLRMARILKGDLDEAYAPVPTSFLEISELEGDIERLRRQQIELKRLESERETLSRELRRLATLDPLTGLMNRRAFEDRMAELLGRPAELGSGLGIVMIDLDHFKSINDRFGHGAGDEVLRGVARFLARELPAGGHAARLGGEEFVLALADVDRAGLEACVETLRAGLEAADLLPRIRLRVTASFGVHWVPSGESVEWNELHRVADRYLYQAKRDGRNRVACSA